MRILGLLKSTLWHADVRTRLIAYKTLCRSLLKYASDAWYPHLAKDMYALEMVQNRAVRFISSLKGVVSVSGEREQLSLQTPEERRTNSRLNTLMKVLDQGCSTGGPGAGCGPPPNFIRPPETLPV